jgi:uracil-DNA glycosylase
VGSFHPSQQNTFTGKLRPAMMDDVLTRARELAEVSEPDEAGAAQAGS